MTSEEPFNDSPLPCCNDDGTHEPYCDVAIYAEEVRIQAELTSLRTKLAQTEAALRLAMTALGQWDTQREARATESTIKLRRDALEAGWTVLDTDNA